MGLGTVEREGMLGGGCEVGWEELRNGSSGGEMR